MNSAVFESGDCRFHESKLVESVGVDETSSSSQTVRQESTKELCIRFYKSI